MLMQKRHFSQYESIYGKLDLNHNLVQVSMDGPNVNLKTVEYIYMSFTKPDSFFQRQIFD